MSDTIVRSSTPPAEPSETHVSEWVENKVGAETNVEDLEPISSDNIVLESLGLDDSISNLPAEEQESVKEVKQYVTDIMKAKGLEENTGNFKKTLASLKYDFGLSDDTDPGVVLDRIGGVIKAWKGLSFITDMREKRNMLFKLARMTSSRDMNKEVFRLMDQYKIWQ